MSTQYQVTIQMSPQTVQELLANGFTLYGFKAVQATGVGFPLVWFATTEFALNVAISWTEQYQACVSQSTLTPGGQVTATSAYDVELGQTFTINNPAGTGVVTQGEVPNAICISNRTTTQFTCGLSQSLTGTPSPLCAFTLFGQNMELIVPLEQVVLIFSTQLATPGTILQQSYGPGIVIDLTGAQERTVSFDINQGWSAGGASWGRTFPGNTNLVPLLIQPSHQLAARKRDMAAIEDPAA